MKVKVSYTVEVTNEYRRALRRYRGGCGMATRAELAEWFEFHGFTGDDDLIAECGDEAAQRDQESDQ